MKLPALEANQVHRVSHLISAVCNCSNDSFLSAQRVIITLLERLLSRLPSAD